MGLHKKILFTKFRRHL